MLNDEVAFWEGRAWRAVHDVQSLTGTLILRAVVSTRVLLTKLALQADSGDLTVEILVGGTPGGTYTSSPTVPINRNRMIPNLPVSQLVLTQGGTLTGGTRTDLLRAFSASGGSAQSVNQADGSIRGLPAGTYYFRITGANGAVGSLVTEWEELD